MQVCGHKSTPMREYNYKGKGKEIDITLFYSMMQRGCNSALHVQVFFISPKVREDSSHE